MKHEVDEDGFAVRPNKTRLKRELAEVRQLVVVLMESGERELAGLTLDSGFLEGLREVARMKPSGARNRQIKYLVKRLQTQDLGAVRQWHEQRDRREAEQNRRFHLLEQWRERLVAEGDAALEAFLQEQPDTDRQQLRQLIRSARKEKETGKPAGAGRKLFRWLRENSATL